MYTWRNVPYGVGDPRDTLSAGSTSGNTSGQGPGTPRSSGMNGWQPPRQGQQTVYQPGGGDQGTLCEWGRCGRTANLSHTKALSFWTLPAEGALCPARKWTGPPAGRSEMPSVQGCPAKPPATSWLTLTPARSCCSLSSEMSPSSSTKPLLPWHYWQPAGLTGLTMGGTQAQCARAAAADALMGRLSFDAVTDARALLKQPDLCKPSSF